MKTALWVAAGLAALYLAAALVTFELVFRRFSGRANPTKKLTNATDGLLAPYRDLIDAGTSWLKTHPAEEVEITSGDGLRLRGHLYLHPEARAILVACHGYRSNGVRDFASACRYYGGHDMSILLVDQRACGKSEGKYITFGVKESADARLWCEYAQARFPALPIVLAGISMGGASVLMTADDLPEHVTAVIDDCGYSSAWDELFYAAGHYIAKPVALLLPGIDLWCRVLAGFHLKERDAVAALKNVKRPVFIVHGEADELVPHAASEVNRAACAAPCEFLSVPGAQHGMSYLVDHDGYCAAVDAFLEKYAFSLAE